MKFPLGALLLTIMMSGYSGQSEACRASMDRRIHGTHQRVGVNDIHTVQGTLLGAVYEVADRLLHQTPTCGMWPVEFFLNHQQGTVLLFGEIHDNPVHHRIRATWLRLEADKRHPDSYARLNTTVAPVVFEQLSSDQQTAIDQAATNESRTIDDFLKAIDWASSGWAQYDYRPLFDAALAAKMPIYAGDVPKSIIRLAAKQGETAVAPEERARLKLDVPLPANQQDAILTELEASHCGMMPKSAFTGMAFAQRLRDATLADVALKAHAAHGSAIVMAGNGHVRGDRGIAWYIRQRAPGIKVVTVALVEVEDGKTDPAAYVPRDPEGRPAVDYVVFTPKQERPDPCDAFKKKP
jgi:uncharacterized iron-regulated protein